MCEYEESYMQERAMQERERIAYRNQEHDQHDEVKQNESKHNP